MTFGNRIEKPVALFSRANRIQRAKDWISQKTLPSKLMLLGATFTISGCASNKATLSTEQNWPIVTQPLVKLHESTIADKNTLYLSFDSFSQKDSSVDVHIGDYSGHLRLHDASSINVSVPAPNNHNQLATYSVSVSISTTPLDPPTTDPVLKFSVHKK